MELEVETGGDLDLGRVRVAIAFADLAGYTRLTEEAGEEEAVDIIERFVEAVQDTLPDDARVIKTIGDEVMIVGSDASAVLDWAVGFQQLQHRAAAAADRHPPGADAVPRRRLLRPRGQPRRAGRRARGGRRGAGHAPARGGRRRRTSSSSTSATSSSRASASPRSCSWRGRRESGGARPRGGPAAAGRPGARPALRRPGLGLPARPRGAGERRGDGAARRLRPARLLRRGRRALRGAVRPAGRAAARPPPAPPRGQPPGLGARRPLRRGAAARRGRRRRRPHRLRPGRDRALPARGVARPARPARHAAARGPRDPPAAGRLAGRDRGVVRRARPGRGARTRPTRPTPTPATAPATGSCRRCASSTRRPRPTCCGRSSCCATRPPCSTPRSTPCWPRPASRRRSRSCARCRPALARLVLVRLAGGAPVGHRADEILALGEHGALDVGGGLRATIERGRVEFVPTPPRVRA